MVFVWTGGRNQGLAQTAAPRQSPRVLAALRYVVDICFMMGRALAIHVGRGIRRFPKASSTNKRMLLRRFFADPDNRMVIDSAIPAVDTLGSIGSKFAGAHMVQGPGTVEATVTNLVHQKSAATLKLHGPNRDKPARESTSSTAAALDTPGGSLSPMPGDTRVLRHGPVAHHVLFRHFGDDDDDLPPHLEEAWSAIRLERDVNDDHIQEITITAYLVP